MKRITVCVRTLIAMLNIAAKEDVRNYLNGVYLEPAGDNNIRYVATNGSVLGLRQVLSLVLPDTDSPDGIRPFIIPRETLERLKLDKRGDTGYLVIHDEEHVDGIPQSRECSLEYHGIVILFKESIGYYPDYRKVTSTRFSGEAAQFNPALVSMIVKTSRQLAPRIYSDMFLTPTIAHNGMDGAGFSVPSVEFYGTLMPISASTFVYPEWLVVESALSVIKYNEKALDTAKHDGCLEAKIPGWRNAITNAQESLASKCVTVGGV